MFDNQVEPSWRADLWQLIRETPALVWLLLTKRPQNIRKMLPTDWADGWPNVWLGTTTEDAEHYRQRWPILASIPARVRFVSYEPAIAPLGALDGRTDVLPTGLSAAARAEGSAARCTSNGCATCGISARRTASRSSSSKSAACAGTAAAANSTVASGRNGRWRRERRSRAVAPHRHRENPRSRIAIR